MYPLFPRNKCQTAALIGGLCAMSLKVRVASLLEIQIVVMNFPEVVDLI